MHEDDNIRLRHILDAGKEALAFSSGKTRKDLNTNRMLVHSLVRVIEIIGEAASKVSDDLKGSHPEIPWADIVGMRNHLIHAYFDVDLDILWNTVTKDLPPLISKIEQIIR